MKSQSFHCNSSSSSSSHGNGIPPLFHLLLLSLLLLLLLSPSAAGQKTPDSSFSDDDDGGMEGSNVSPSMALIVIVLVLAFFITGCVSIYIQQCSNSSAGDPFAVAGGSRPGNYITGGLDKSVIDTLFPTFVYSAVKELKIGKGSLECAVCLSEFEEDETLRLLPKCNHVFHPDCIDAWLIGHSTCPVCRANLDPNQPGGNPAGDSSHEIDSRVDSDSSSGSGLPSCEVRIAISEEIPNRNRKLRRSHSTGHSVVLVRPGDDSERFTLRLPAEVRRQLLARSKLKRATSLLVALPRAPSSRRGYRGGGGGEGSGSSRYGRIFGRSPFNFAVPPFMTRVASFKSTTKVGVDGGVTAGAMGSKRFLGAVVTPLESLPRLPV